MTPKSRTPQQRDHRFARIRRLTQAVFLGSGVVSAVLVGYVASAAKPTLTTPVTVPTTVAPTTTTPAESDSGSVSTTVPYTPPTTAPVTTATVCTTTPSGTTSCH